MFRRIIQAVLLFNFLIISDSYAIKALKQGDSVVTGACRFNEYLPLLKGKNVALLVNQTSVVGNTALLDTLLKSGVKVVKIFVPEHGFRGAAQAGDSIDNSIDSATKLPIVSLYGDKKKPKAAQLADVDVVVYDIQDVGARFYTYISTLQYAMEACAENKKEFIVLDRPNPNGHYVDGPVLKPEKRSFVGMQCIPIVYGMTVGEYAKMLVGEKWFNNAAALKLKVIACKQYDHNTLYTLPVRPSPNLKTQTAIYCYPSSCLFEGTVVSIGRGTALPFQQYGHPAFQGKAMFSFRPVPVWGQKTNPPYAYEDCYGQVIALDEPEALKLLNRRIRLIWLLRAYEWFPEKDKFFNSYFDTLAGTTELKKQIQEGWTEEKITTSWQKDIAAFKKIRKKYLLYTDFE